MQLKKYVKTIVIFIALATTVRLALPVAASEAPPLIKETIERRQGVCATPIFLPIVLKGSTVTGVGGNLVASLTSSRAFDVVVSVHNAPTGAQRTAYEENFRYFADSVYEMSNGAHKIRQIQIYPNRQSADTANIIWIPTCHPNAHVSAYGKQGNGTRIEMCDQFVADGQLVVDFLADDAGRQNGGYTTGHEWGHYFYGLLDEYVGSGTSTDAGSPVASDVGVQNSIMNGQSNAIAQEGQPADFSWLNFSTPLNNGDTGMNAQRRVFASSAWETLVRPADQDSDLGKQQSGGLRLYYPDLAQVAPPAGQTPSLQLPAGQTEARNLLNIAWMGDSAAAPISISAVTEVGMVRYLVIETSSSMAATDKLVNVKDALSQLVQEAEIGDFIGIIAYDSQVKVVQPLTQITNDTVRTAILTALEGITASADSGAATSQAALKALSDITAAGIPTDLNRGVYLITDGPGICGVNFLFGVAPAYSNQLIELYTFGYGVSGALGKDLATVEETGGEYRYIDDSDPDVAFDDLLDGLENADQNLSPIVEVNVKTSLTTVLSTTPLTTPFVVDNDLGEIAVEVVYQGAQAGLALQLLNPSSVAVDPPTCDTLGTGGADTDTRCNFVVSNPLTGTWNLVGMAPSADVDMEYLVTGLAKDGDFALDTEVGSLNGKYIQAPEAIVLLARLFNPDYYVTDVTVSGTVEAPNGSLTPFTMRDDGVAPDNEANDGVYAATIPSSTDGDYYILISFDNNNGLAKFTEASSQFAADPTTGVTKAIAPPFLVGTNFERFAEIQVNVTGN